MAPPAADKPWADSPFALLETPSKTRPLATSHFSVRIASDMAHAHNTFLRSLNSIYNQAAHIPADDKEAVTDFLCYCRFWCDAVDHHHAAEEAVFFPAVERMAGKPGMMSVNVKQHETFHNGMVQFREHVTDAKRVEEYDGEALKRVVDSFAPALQAHLREEIDSMLGLKDLDDGELRKEWQLLEDYALTADKYTLFPWIFGCIDYGYEGGIHRGVFPPTPWFVAYLVKYYYARRYVGCWRFNPCDGFGNRRELLYGA